MDSPFHRTCTELRVEAHVSKEVDSLRCDVECNVLFGKHLLHCGYLQAHHVGNLFLGEWQEHYRLVDTVEKLRANGLFQHFHHGVLGMLYHFVAVLVVHLLKLTLNVLRPEVRGHYDDGVLEVHHTALVVGKSSVVENLQENVEHIGMCLLNLVEEHHRIWFAAHCLGQLSALVVAHISWRCADETAHAELLLILRHVYSRHHLLVVEQILGKSLGEFGLSNACRSHEDERCDGSFRVLQSCTAAAHGIADGGDCLVLSDDTAVQFLLQMQQFLALALQHTRHGDACPAAHHFGNVVGGYLFAHHAAAFTLCQLLCQRVDVVLKSLQPAVPYLSHPCVVALALGTLSLKLQLLHLLLVLLNLVHQTLLALPFSAELVFAVAQFGDVLVQL